MDIKKANVNLLLGKIRTYLDTQPETRKKGKRFIEAEKALAKLEKVFVNKNGELELVACLKNQRVYPTK
jgi:hypothetical protein